MVKVNYELLLSLIMIVAGLAMFAVRNRPNPVIGVRFGYTYLSKEAWKKSNTFAGLYCLILGLCFLVISLIVRIPFEIFITMFIISVSPMVYYSYKIAKKTYEMEDLSTPVGNVKPMFVDVRRLLTLELIPLVLYVLIVVVLWDRIPQKYLCGITANFNFVSHHYVMSYHYASKFVGALLIPVIAMLLIMVLTVFARREPLLLFRIPTSPSILVLLQAFLAIMFLSFLLYNVRLISMASMFFVILMDLVILITVIALKYRIRVEG